MIKLPIVVFLSLLTLSVNAESKCAELKCGEPPSFLLLDKDSVDFRKNQDIFNRYNKCLIDCSAKKDVVDYSVYLSSKESLENCERILPKVFKDSYETQILGVTNITKKSPNTSELNQMILKRTQEKTVLCNELLSGKHDLKIHGQKMNDLKMCFDNIKSKKQKPSEFTKFETIKLFLENRDNKRMSASAKGSDLLNVQRKLEDCQMDLSNFEAKQQLKVDHTERSKPKSFEIHRRGLQDVMINRSLHQ